MRQVVQKYYARSFMKQLLQILMLLCIAQAVQADMPEFIEPKYREAIQA